MPVMPTRFEGSTRRRSRAAPPGTQSRAAGSDPRSQRFPAPHPRIAGPALSRHRGCRRQLSDGSGGFPYRAGRHAEPGSRRAVKQRGSRRAGRRLSGRPGALTVTRHAPGCPAAGPERRLQAVAGGRVTESSGGMPQYGSISTRASWPVQPWLRVEEGRSAVSTLGLP